MIDWIIRLSKGVIIGTGFILPGVSGGVLATILGLYEKMIRFLADIRQDFIKNFRFFFPVGTGVIISMFISSVILKTFFDIAELQLIWLFIGCVAATIPMLVKEAGKNGRKLYHYFIMGGVTVVTYLFLINIRGVLEGINLMSYEDNIVTKFLLWMLAGVLMGLGAIVPGLSPSNFLLYLKMYEPMTENIKNLDVLVIFAILAGAAACFLLFSKAVKYLFDHVYAGLFHSLLGIIIASTLAIIPKVKNGIYKREVVEDGITSFIDIQVGTLQIILCIVTFSVGIGIGLLMGLLEKKYKSD